MLDVFLPFVFVVCILSIQTFHWHTHKTVWKNYRVLFVPSNQNISSVMQLLKQAGITKAISVQSMEERFFSEETPPYFTQQEQYLQWFENKNDKLSYIYIPKSSYIPLSLLKSLHDSGIQYYMEGNLHSRTVNIISIAVLFVTFLSFSLHRSLFFFSALPYLLLAPLISGVVIFTSILIFIVATFFAIEILVPPSNLNDKQKKMRERENLPFFALFFIAFCLCFFDSFLFFVYVTLSFLASVCSLYSVGKFQHLFEKEKDAKRVHKKPIFYPLGTTFSPRLMTGKKMIASLFLIPLCYLLHIIFFFVFCLPLSESYGNKLAFPSPSNTMKHNDFSASAFVALHKNTNAELMPCLIHYICDEWYKTLNKEKPSQINFVDERRIDEIINDAFIATCLEKTKPASIERLLLSEGGFALTFYAFRFLPIERLRVLQLIISLLSIFASLAIILFKMVR